MLSQLQIPNSFDSHFYLKTQHAWYILATPARIYRPFFINFWAKERIFHLVAHSALDNDWITLAQFIWSLAVTPESAEVLKSTRSMLGRDLIEEDIISLVGHLIFYHF